ncbi:copper chaperone CopZ [Caryophanon tenue]|uniref:Copper resistance protein CopZ n=1 Tax=Caryophanon tenue TaxID=33978 RepID=A0A1C0YDB9_9BACL|nr:copper chaperone CopZ [Caryophanon tenue]OCS85145.1 copper resistance protein CopZ [Caryophanon tenue]
MQEVTLNVQGMSCGHCVKAVEDSVGALAGVQTVAVNLADAQVTVAFDEAVTVDTIKETIEEQGYDIV